MNPVIKQYLDIAERAAWTFVQTAVGLLIASPVWSSVDTGGAVKGAAAAGLAAALSVAKGLLATHLGAKGTASTLPAAADPATPPTGA